MHPENLIASGGSVSVGHMTNHPDPLARIMKIEDFQPLHEQDFTLSFGDEQFALKLVEVTPSRNFHPDPNMRPPFALLFKCADQRILPQQMHSMHCESLGALEIFLVPVAGDAEGISYEAVFN